MWYFVVSIILLFVGCGLCCSGEIWAVVFYLPSIVLMAWNEAEQSRKRGTK